MEIVLRKKLTILLALGDDPREKLRHGDFVPSDKKETGFRGFPSLLGNEEKRWGVKWVQTEVLWQPRGGRKKEIFGRRGVRAALEWGGKPWGVTKKSFLAKGRHPVFRIGWPEIKPLSDISVKGESLYEIWRKKKRIESLTLGKNQSSYKNDRLC